MLIVAAAAEILFLIGLFAKWDNGFMWGIFLLIACAWLGIFYIGIESILVLSKDLNTKQSYMLFMVPRSSYQVLGAKVLGSLISIAAAGLFFILIAVLDASLAAIYVDGLKAFMDNVNMFLKTIFENMPSMQDILNLLIIVLLQWFLTVIIGYLAVILSCTVLTGKRFSGLISFLLFFVLFCAVGMVVNHLPDFSGMSLDYLLHGAVIFTFSAVFYLISCWIMERKLSV